jgi:hypothetical protein
MSPPDETLRRPAGASTRSTSGRAVGGGPMSLSGYLELLRATSDAAVESRPRFCPRRFERPSSPAVSRDDRWAWNRRGPAASVLITYDPTLKDLVQRNARGLPPPPPWLFASGRRRSAAGRGRRRDETLRDLKVPVPAVFSSTRLTRRQLGWPIVTLPVASRPYQPLGLHRHATGSASGPQLLHDRLSRDRPNFEPASHGGFPSGADAASTSL